MEEEKEDRLGGGGGGGVLDDGEAGFRVRMNWRKKGGAIARRWLRLVRLVVRSNSWVGYGEQAMVDSVCESSSSEESWAIVGEEVPPGWPIYMLSCDGCKLMSKLSQVARDIAIMRRQCGLHADELTAGMRQAGAYTYTSGHHPPPLPVPTTTLNSGLVCPAAFHLVLLFGLPCFQPLIPCRRTALPGDADGT
jgi:hypothetical protein